MPFSSPKWCICPEQNFFGTNYYYYFHLAIGPFHCAKLKKIVTMDPELWGCTIFGPKMVPFAPHKFFFWKLLISFSSTYYSLSLCKILKRFFQLIQSYENLQFLGPKWPIFLNGHFKKKNLLMSLVSLICVYLYSTNESQILICYWNIDD